MTIIKPIVHVVDDDASLRDALRWLLESVAYHVETYEDGHIFLNNFNIQHQGCVLLDVRMPGSSGLQIQEQLAEKENHMPIIMMTGHGDIAMAVRAIKMGAIDFVTKPFNNQLLLELVHRAIVLDQENCKNLVYIQKIRACYLSLNIREKAMLEAVVAGKLNKVIADELSVSIKTVELTRSHLMEKMFVKSLAQLVQIYMQLQQSEGNS